MNLEQYVDTYMPPTSAIEFLNDTKIALLVGISGAGKDTIQARLLENPDYHSIITHTTRPPRENNGVLEQNGREYHFVTEVEMAALLENHELIEINKFGQNYYGTSLAEFRKAYAENKIALGDIDTNGIAAFRAVVGEAVRAIFVVPPDYQSWRQRLEARYTSEEAFERELPARRAIAIDELEHALGVAYFHIIINDDLERAIGAVDDIAHRPNTFVRQDDEARLAARDLLEDIRRRDI
ncbi:MAG: guanylate kinase [Candidatus Saccharibacteria bacterium]|nr:guanylate kinase [Candidatus Saccharibacteria bacterium]